MKKCRRLMCLLFAAALFLTFAPLRAGAAATLYFTAVNDTLLDLNDKTMPFWQGGVLYVPGEALRGSDLGIGYNYNREKKVATLYRQQNALYCDLSAGTIEDNHTGEQYDGAAIVRGDTVFFPVGVTAKFFDLSYSCTRISYGYLVRIKSDSAVLSDSLFIDAATQSFQQRYTQYERARQRAEETDAEQKDESAQSGSAQRGELTVYPLVRVTDSTAGMQLLNLLGSYRFRATLLFTAESLETAGDLARRAAASGCAAAIVVENARSADDALAQITRANAALWQAANVQTRLIYLPDGTRELRAALSEAGYCPVSEGVSDLSRTGSRWAEETIQRAGSRSVLRVYLGTDASAAASGFGSALNRLRTESCTVAALNEVTA